MARCSAEPKKQRLTALWACQKLVDASRNCHLGFQFCLNDCVCHGHKCFTNLGSIARLMKHLALVFVTLVITLSSFFENALNSNCLPGNAVSNASSILGSIRRAARRLCTKIMRIGVDLRLLKRFVLRSAGSTGDGDTLERTLT